MAISRSEPHHPDLDDVPPVSTLVGFVSVCRIFELLLPLFLACLGPRFYNVIANLSRLVKVY